jgi:hypothetical protein
MKSRRSKRSLPPKLFALGAILFLSGYGLLQYLIGAGANPGPGRLIFWIGLVLMVVGTGMWLAQPPRKSRREQEDEEEQELEHATTSAALANDDDDDLIPCPYCREPIYEQSERCPNCGKYISAEDALLVMPTWVIVGVVLGLMVTIFWLVSGH